MKTFMDEDFLLQNETAKSLYQFAKKMPIIDYHCHLDPKEIAEDVTFENITKVWLGGDHYKWRLMRQMGIDEEYITGNATDYDKFMAWAKTLELAIGNPLYHWSHLELKRYFDIDEPLSVKSADRIWEACNQKLKKEGMSALGLIKKSNVVCIGTTDDPVDDLKWHELLADKKEGGTKVIPTFRPDQIMNPGAIGFKEYIDKLSEVSQVEICDYNTFCQAIKNRIDYFDQRGCKSSDHSFLEMPYQLMNEVETNKLMDKIFEVKSVSLSEEELLVYQTNLMLFLAEEYAQKNWVMQLHFGVVRNSNQTAFETLGKDKGFDRIKGVVDTDRLALFLDTLNQKKALPKTILYSLNANDNSTIQILCNCFYETDVRGKVQQGAAWWFQDHKNGMEDMLKNMSQSGMLAVSVGMLTDSRSFLSYTRHEYFRRILCNYIGTLVENGEYPNDMELLQTIVENICFYNAKNYFEL